MSLLTELRANTTLAAAGADGFISEANLSRYNEILEKAKLAAESGDTDICLSKLMPGPLASRLRQNGFKLTYSCPENSEYPDRVYISWRDVFTSSEFSILQELQSKSAKSAKFKAVQEQAQIQRWEERYNEIIEQMRVQSKSGSHNISISGKIPDYIVKKLEVNGLRVGFNGPCRCESEASYGCTCDGKMVRVTETIIIW